MMKQLIALAAAIAGAAALLAAGLAVGATPPSPPHELHLTRCSTTVGDTTRPYKRWGLAVTMVLGGGSADTLWITSPASLAGHYVIQNYQGIEGTSTTEPPEFPGWSPIGLKNGLQGRIECKGYFLDGSTIWWVDSIDALVR